MTKPAFRFGGILQETGKSFAERVMELRLQKRRSMLASRLHDRLKISDIAYAAPRRRISAGG